MDGQNVEDALPPESDDALAARLGALLERLDPAPGLLAATARDAFGLTRLDADLAELAFDSWQEEASVALRAGDEGPRQLTFEGPALRLDVEVGTTTAGAGSLRGQVIPRGRGHVEIHDATGSRRGGTEIDAAGRFVLERPPTGTVRLVCTPEAAATPTATDWVVLG